MSNVDWGQVSKTGVVPDGMSLLVEEKEFNVIQSREISEKSGKKKLRLTGIIQKASDLNENGRVYSSNVLSEAVDAIQESIMKRKVTGELDHSCDAKIHMDRISHLMTKVWMESKNVLGELEVIEETPCGQILSALVKAGITVGISSRGVGDMRPCVNEDTEYYEVLPGYRFITWDVVAEPSVKEAELSVMESKQRIITRRSQIEKEIIKEIAKKYFIN